MKRILIAVAAGSMLVAGVALAAEEKAPEKVLEIKECQKAKGPVNFDHQKHFKAKPETKCIDCHHKGKNEGCTTCHKQAQEKIGTCADMSPTKNPFHVKCIACHKAEAAKFPAAPVKCDGCHIKK